MLKVIAVALLTLAVAVPPKADEAVQRLGIEMHDLRLEIRLLFERQETRNTISDLMEYERRTFLETLQLRRELRTTSSREAQHDLQTAERQLQEVRATKEKMQQMLTQIDATLERYRQEHLKRFEAGVR
jgi:hypothetical protein